MSHAAASGIILAAGRSRRMGALKPLLPVGDSPAVLRAATAFSDVGVHPVVVLGYAADTIAPVLREAGVEFVVNRGFADGMFSSVATGLGAVSPCDDFTGVLPADCCLVRAETIGRLARAMTTARSGVVCPVAGGRRGHPPLLGEPARQRALAAPRDAVLHEILREMESIAVDVPVPDGGILLDMDEPDQYERMRELSRREGLPDAARRAALLRHTPPRVREHGVMVAAVAEAIGGALQPAGAHLQLALLKAAALLHDIARQERDHAAAGARRLVEAGYPRVASVVARHMDLGDEPAGIPDEAEVLFLADKLVDGSRVITLDERRRRADLRFGTDERASAAAQLRLAAAGQIAAAVERLSGRGLERVLASVRPPA